MKINNKKLFFSGIAIVTAGIVILGVFGWKRISSEIRKHILLEKCVVLEIPDADIKIPVVEGTDGENLHIAAGHFKNTGSAGYGNYCIAGHNSTIYAEVFNTLSEVRSGSEIFLTDNDENHTKYEYVVTDIQIVEPKDTWVLNDYGDNRITIVTCTDDGRQRFIVTGMKKQT